MLLSSDDAKDFIRLHSGLMNYVHAQGSEGKGRKKPYLNLGNEARLAVHLRFAEDPGGHVAAYTKANPDRLSLAEIAEIAAWKDAVCGRLVLFRQLKKHLVAIEPKQAARVFGILGLTQPIDDIVGHPLPCLVECNLLPFRGAIVFDGMLAHLAVDLGPAIRRGLNESYRAAKATGRLLTALGEAPPPPAPKRTRRAAAKKPDPLRRLVTTLRKRISEYRSHRAELRRFEDETIPAFESWVETTFKKEREEGRKLHQEIDELEEALFRLSSPSPPPQVADSDVFGPGEDPDEDLDEHDDFGNLPEPPEFVMEILFQKFMQEIRGIDPNDMDPKEADEAFAQFRATFRHAAEGDHAAFERTLMGVGADRSSKNVKAVKAAYRRIAKRLHPDKHGEHCEVVSELWEVLRSAKEALDIETILRVEVEWRLLGDGDFAPGDEPALKTLQSQLRRDFADLRSLRADLEGHPMWGHEGKTPPQSVVRNARAGFREELEDLRRFKRHLSARLKHLRNQPKKPGAKKKGKSDEISSSLPKQREFDF